MSNERIYGTTKDIETVRRSVEAALGIALEPRYSDHWGYYFRWKQRVDSAYDDQILVCPNEVPIEKELRYQDHPEWQTLVVLSAFNLDFDAMIAALHAEHIFLVERR